MGSCSIVQCEPLCAEKSSSISLPPIIMEVKNGKMGVSPTVLTFDIVLPFTTNSWLWEKDENKNIGKFIAFQKQALTPPKINSWNLKMMVWSRWFSLSHGCILRFRVNLLGCMSVETWGKSPWLHRVSEVQTETTNISRCLLTWDFWLVNNAQIPMVSFGVSRLEKNILKKEGENKKSIPKINLKWFFLVP